MAQESILVQSAFRGLGDEDDEEKTEEAPLDESLDEDKSLEGGSTEDDEEEEF